MEKKRIREAGAYLIKGVGDQTPCTGPYAKTQGKGPGSTHTHTVGSQVKVYLTKGNYWAALDDEP